MDVIPEQFIDDTFENRANIILGTMIFLAIFVSREICLGVIKLYQTVNRVVLSIGLHIGAFRAKRQMSKGIKEYDEAISQVKEIMDGVSDKITSTRDFDKREKMLENLDSITIEYDSLLSSKDELVANQEVTKECIKDILKQAKKAGDVSSEQVEDIIDKTRNGVFFDHLTKSDK